MKKHLIALAILGTLAGTASAQSSVTLYGAIQLGAVRETGKQMRLDAGNGASYIGFKGAEDLGNGLKATFDLQQRFSPESGSNDGSSNGRPLFQGQTFVGLSSADYGSINLGRGKTPLESMIDSGTPFTSIYQASQDLLGVGYATDPRLASTSRGGLAGNTGDDSGAQRTDHIAYISPKFSGFSARLGYGFKNSAADGNTTTDTQNTKNLVSLRADYANGPVFVALGHERNRQKDKLTALTATYDFQVAKLWYGHGSSTVDTTDATRNLTALSGRNKRSVNTYTVTAPFGAFTPALGYARIKATGTAAEQTTNKLSLGSWYTLSKRTSFYATYYDQKVKQTSVKTKGAELGVAHTF